METSSHSKKYDFEFEFPEDEFDDRDFMELVRSRGWELFTNILRERKSKILSYLLDPSNTPVEDAFLKGACNQIDYILGIDKMVLEGGNKNG